jgi:pantothenate kinase-related protein Tda10
VWEIWEYEKLWEKAKKLIHEDTTNIKRREKDRHTQKHRQAHKHTHEHTQTHTHTRMRAHTRTHTKTQEPCLHSRHDESNLP